MKRAFFLLALVLAGSAQASYGQMRLDGIGLALAFILVVGHGLLVDGALFVRLFRYRTAIALSSIIAVAVAFFLLSQAASSSERAGFFKATGAPELVAVVVTSAVFLPFILVAPFAQYRAMREGLRWPDWIVAWMAVQLALLPGFIALGFMDEHFSQRERAAGQAVGSQVEAGGLGGILELARKRHERIWGTGWTYPWTLDATSRDSAWNLGLATGVDGSALIAADEPLGDADRAALQALMEKPWAGYGVLQIRTKLLWDALYPGGFSSQLAPHGVSQGVTVGEEVIPVLIERLEKHGGFRLCPGGRMMDADRAVLNELVLAKVSLYDEAKKRELAYEAESKQRDLEMSEAPFPYGLLWKASNALGDVYGEASPVLDWDSYRQRVERLCMPG